MKIFRMVIALTGLLTILLAGAESHSCSAFRVTAGDGTIISARTMEFGRDLNYAMIVVPRGEAFSSPAPCGGEGAAWSTKYGYAAGKVTTFGG